VDVRPEAERRYNDELSADLERTVWTQCDSYFRSPSGRIVTQWPYTELEYARRTWRLRPREWLQRTRTPPLSGAPLANAQIDDTADQLAREQVGTGALDFVEHVAPRDQ
jgi:hypothetical protein